MILDIIDFAEIKSYLSEKKVETILSDIFDTILCRTTHPEVIKKIVAARLNDHIDSIPKTAFIKQEKRLSIIVIKKAILFMGILKLIILNLFRKSMTC